MKFNDQNSEYNYITGPKFTLTESLNKKTCKFIRDTLRSLFVCVFWFYIESALVTSFFAQADGQYF